MKIRIKEGNIEIEEAIGEIDVKKIKKQIEKLKEAQKEKEKVF